MDNRLICFFDSYVFFVKYLICCGYDSKYKTLISKDSISDNMVRVNISITYDYDSNDTLYSNFIILDNRDYDKLIDMIRDDFTGNYDIVFCAINSISNLQFFYKDNFVLYIKLYNEDEYNRAFMYNRSINASINKKRVLSK